MDSTFEARTWLNMAFAHKKVLGIYYFRLYLYDIDMAPGDIAKLSKGMGFEKLFQEIYKYYIETEAERKHQDMDKCREILKEWGNGQAERADSGAATHY